MTLRIKASILIVIILTVSLAISGYYYLAYFEKSLRNSIYKGLDSVSSTASREISNFLMDGLKEAEAVAEALPNIAIEQQNSERIDAILKSYFSIFPKFANGMFVLDESGNLWADYPFHSEVRGKSFAFRQYFQKTMAEQKGIIGTPYQSARTGKPVLTFTAVLRDTSGRIAGMLGCSVELTSPDALEGIRLTKIGQTGYTYVYDKDRLMILHPNEDRILKNDVPVGTNKLFDAAIEGFQGTGETVNSRGIPMLISMKHIPHTNWIVGAQQPKSEAFAPIESAKTRIVWGILLVAAASAFVGALLMRGITKPLITLQKAIKAVGNTGESDNGVLVGGGFKAELEAIKEGGEIGNLKTAFLSMSERLDSAMRTLHKLADDWEKTFDSVIDVIFLLDKENKIVRLNRAAKDLLNKPYQELIDKPISGLLSIPPEKIWLASGTNDEKDKSFNLSITDRQIYEIYCNSLADEKKAIIGTVLVGRDITSRLEANKERLRLEEKLQKARKMEAIGTLAGGVAHDLNNILSGIVSYPELLLMQLPKDSPLVEPLETIFQSGKRATAIVQDLLTLARRGAATLSVLNINPIVDDYLKSPEFRKLKSFHPRVQIATRLAQDLLNIEGSSVHLSKMLMNLVSNAAEAMPRGGSIQIATENKYLDTKISGHEDITEGDYVVLTVSDNGLGIAPGDIDRIFEPFYTKKKMGLSGTGLGMSVVWGTVKDHSGFIDLTSALGVGTTFKIYFPVTRKTLQANSDRIDLEDLYGAGETILVVDDVAAQREIATSILTQLGYAVSSVASGEQALSYLKDHSVDLLVLDMIMAPGMDGLETYRKALEIAPNQKAIITSGYAETDSVAQAQALGAGPYVKKPYTIEKIGLAVKSELDKAGNSKETA